MAASSAIKFGSSLPPRLHYCLLNSIDFEAPPLMTSLSTSSYLGDKILEFF